LDNYCPFQATRADLLRRLGRNSEAAAAYERAATMASTDAERDFLRLGGRASRRANR
jgi:RNA polymerase sigma-70 factor (ECF subfamily)